MLTSRRIVRRIASPDRHLESSRIDSSRAQFDFPCIRVIAGEKAECKGAISLQSIEQFWNSRAGSSHARLRDQAREMLSIASPKRLNGLSCDWLVVRKEQVRDDQRIKTPRVLNAMFIKGFSKCGTPGEPHSLDASATGGDERGVNIEENQHGYALFAACVNEAGGMLAIFRTGYPEDAKSCRKRNRNHTFSGLEG
jgi:hypothetical protein